MTSEEPVLIRWICSNDVGWARQKSDQVLLTRLDGVYNHTELLANDHRTSCCSLLQIITPNLIIPTFFLIFP